MTNSPWEPGTPKPLWKRYRPGTSRALWNAQTMFRYDTGPLEGTLAPLCASCGYRDHEINMLSLGGLIPRADQQEGYCFPCYLQETNPAAVERYWAGMEGKSGAKVDTLKGTRVTSSGLTGLPTDFGTGKRR